MTVNPDRSDLDDRTNEPDEALSGAGGGDFFVDQWLAKAELNRLQHNGDTVQVEPRVFQVLVRLADNPGRVVTRDSLLETVWSDAIVNEESLTRAISELRHIFGDDPRSPRFIETIRKGGYRLIAAVRRVPAEAQDQPAPVDEGQDQTVPPSMPARRHTPVAWMVAIVAMAVTIGVVWRWNMQLKAAPPVLEAVPFTSYQGEENRPAVSPDGSRVAFAWSGQDRNFDIYVKQRNTETPLRLTEHAATDSAPVWSPDGAEVAFIRYTRSGSAVLTVPAIGGGVRLLYDGGSLIDSLDWSPDGQWLVFSERDQVADPCHLSLLSLATQEVSRLTSPPPQYTGDVRPVFSPDGSSIAFIRGDTIGLNDIFATKTAGGEPRRITSGCSGVRGLDWTADGEEILFSSLAKGPFSLWRADADDGSLSRMPVNVEWVCNPSLAAKSQLLVFEARSFELDIWRVMLDDEGYPRHFEQPFINSTRVDTQARYSPDGSRIAFISGRSGSLEIWISNADGSSPVQLTDLGGTLVGNPRWSPNGRSIAFYMPDAEFAAVYVADVATGTVRKLSETGHNDRMTSWSRDGRWLYFGSDRTGSWQVWRMDGAGQNAEEVTYDGGITAQESVDGQHIYFVKPGVDGIWRMGRDGGGAELVVARVHRSAARDWDNWLVMADGIYLTRAEIGGHSIAFHDFASGEARAITRLPSRPDRRSLAISPDHRSALYSRTIKQASDLMIVEGFD